MTSITITLDDDLAVELADVARREGVTMEDLVREGLERLRHSRLGPGVPQFARRLGPLTVTADDAAVDPIGPNPPSP
jgi:hypothetical protein